MFLIDLMKALKLKKLNVDFGLEIIEGVIPVYITSDSLSSEEIREVTTETYPHIEGADTYILVYIEDTKPNGLNSLLLSRKWIDKKLTDVNKLMNNLYLLLYSKNYDSISYEPLINNYFIVQQDPVYVNAFQCVSDLNDLLRNFKDLFTYKNYTPIDGKKLFDLQDLIKAIDFSKETVQRYSDSKLAKIGEPMTIELLEMEEALRPF